MSALEIVVTAAGAVAFAFAAVRWLRIAQREHYLFGSATRFARRWWGSTNVNVALVCVAVFTAALAFAWPITGLATAAIAVVGPIGLSLRGRTSRLTWTRRLRTAAIVTVLVTVVVVVVVGLLFDRAPSAVAVSGLVAPLLVDDALWLVAPLERALARRHIKRATATLRRVAPTVVAITGSYGKTTTKQYARHLVSGSRRIVASPASFNNAAGLSRAITEQLAPGTEVFIAEMGTYGKGEIASLCEWVQPEIGVVTAIGPVHLERMGSLDTIVAAKSEILECVKTAVLNVDAYGLAAVADANRVAGKRVIACSAERLASPVDVRVLREDGRSTIDAGESRTATVDSTAQPTNLACAIAIALALDVPWDEIVPRLAGLPQPEHRQEIAVAASGVHVIDNTFSSNPASAESSLSLLAFTGEIDARRVVVTPGMVELGNQQPHENERFGSGASLVADDIVVVGHTNRRALLQGAAGGLATVHEVATSRRGSRVGARRTEARRRRLVRERPARPLPVTSNEGSPDRGHPGTRGCLCQHVRVTQPAVLFGGPSPEHDISVLTGLQAAGAFAKDGVEITAIYWARSGDFFEVDPSLEPSAFVEGVPRGAHRLDLVARPGGGFVREGGRLGRRAPLDDRCGRELLSRRARRGRHLAGGARPGRGAVHRTERCRRGTRHGQARVRRRDARSGAVLLSPAWPSVSVASPTSRARTS